MDDNYNNPDFLEFAKQDRFGGPKDDKRREMAMKEWLAAKASKAPKSK